MSKYRNAVTAIYAAVAIITFGRSYAYRTAFYEQRCASAGERLLVGRSCYEPMALGALIAGAAWPLYWSQEAWSPRTQDETTNSEGGESHG